MSIQWIRDVDTGELYPVQDDFEYEPPAHLKKAEYTPIDYEKTTRMTIDELQNQLIAAQNEIESIQQEKGSTAVSEVTVKEVYPETVTRKRFDFNLPKVIITIVVSSVFSVLVFLGFNFVSDNNFFIDTNIFENTELTYEFSPIYTGDDGTAMYINSNSSDKDTEQQYTDHQDTEEETENPFLNLAFRLLIFIIPIWGVQFAIRFMKRSIGC